MSGKLRFAFHRLLFLSVILCSFGIIFAQKAPTYASTAPFNITGTIDTNDLVFDTNKVLLDCTSVWSGGSNFHYEARQITVDQSATLTFRDVNNTPPASPTTTNDVSYGVFDVTSTPFNASNLPLTSQCIGAATNSLNVAMQPGNIYWLVIRHFNNANGAPSYNLEVTSTNNVANIVVGAPGGAPPPVPKIVNITSSAPDGNYGPGATISIDVIFDYPVEYTSIGSYMILTLNNGSAATCTYCNAYPTAASTTYTFSYPIGGSNIIDLDEVSINALDLAGGTLKGTDGTTASTTTPAPGAAGSLGANKNINIVTPQLSANNPSVTEGNAGTTTAAFTVSLSPVLVQPTITVDYATVNGTATTADNDYVATSGTFTFAPGETSKTVNVTVNGDTKNEANETFKLDLSNASNASISSDGTGTITNDDPLPSLSIDDKTITEGNSGTSTASFTVNLSAVSGQTVTVNYATANGTATTADGDYVAASGTLTFTPGQTSKTVNVTVNGDTKYEANEDFQVNLSGATNATITDSQGLGTITNDDTSPIVSISPVTVTEGNSGTTNADFTVTLSAVSGLTASVHYVSNDDTAKYSDNDFVVVSGTLTFAPGETSKTISVPIKGDTKDEADETFYMYIGVPTNAQILIYTGEVLGTILNDDTAPGLSIGNVTVNEGDSGTTNATFTVNLSAASGKTVTVNYATADGTATTANSDYTATSGTLTFAPGETSKTVNVTVNGDNAFEPDETFTVTLSAPTNATLTTATGTGTITNDDPQALLSINNVTVTEGNSGTTNAAFTVTMSPAILQTVTVNYATSNGTATTANGDYTAASGTLTFAPGETSKTITVPVSGDTIFELDETFNVTLSAPTNASITTAIGTGTITNDDTAPTLSIGNVSVTEGNAGTVNATFTVSLSSASGVVTTVDYVTSNGTATTADNDYVATSGTLTFTAGQTSQTVNVSINGDTKDEVDETLTVTLSNPGNATITTASGTGTIINDDTAPTLSIANTAVTEGNSGTTNAAFTVTLSAVSGKTVTVDYTMADGTATTADNDYVATSGTLTFTPGQTSQTVNVTVNGDTKNEANETFTVTLSAPTNATITTATGTGTINNDDAAPGLSIGNATVTEGNSGTTTATFTVTLAAVSGQTVTVDYATSNGTAATADNDYAATSGTLTFTPGQTNKTIDVTVNGDTKDEVDETFTVTLSAPTNATITTANGTGTINNDDTAPTLSIGDTAVTEGNSGTTNAAFTVTLAAASGKTVTVDYVTSNGTATTADNDYAATSGTLTFTPGQTSQTVNVSINGDTKNEADETFTVTLSAPTNATITTASGTGTINNDDAVPGLSIGNSAVTEGNSGTATTAFTVTLSAVSGKTVTVDYATSNGTATTADNDYAATSGTLTFTPGQTSQTVNVTVNGDTKNEANETFTVTLSAPTNATITTANGTGTINNDDAVPSLSIGGAAVFEDNSGTTAFNFMVTLSAISGQTVTVNYASADGMATTADGDYTVTSGTLTFAPGQTSQIISVLVNGDTKNEADELFTVTLSTPANATITTAIGTGIITNDDAVPGLSIGNAAVTEGNAGTVNATFTVTLAAVSGQTVTVDYATSNGTATTADNDYVATSGTLTFTPGQTSQTVNVTVNGDTKDEANETFTVTLSNPTNATITTADGTGTITNDDTAPSLSIGDAAVTEGNSGTTTATFTVTLAAVSGKTVTVDYTTTDGTAAAADSDYTATSGTLTFTPGQTSQTVNVTVNGDTKDEADETFTVTLSNPTNATITTASGTGTINNDDTAPDLSINSVTLSEGDSGTTAFNFTVTLSAVSGKTVTVNYASADGTALAGSDYTAASGTLTFAPGETSKTITVLGTGETYYEMDETFSVSLSAPTNATISIATGTGTINNDDGQPSFSIGDVTQAEGNSGTTAFVFTVTRSGDPSMTDTVGFMTNDGTALAGSDYTALSGTLTFAPGETSQTISVMVNGDISLESDETFTVDLSNASGQATIMDNQAVGTITNDDVPAGLAIGDVTLAEGDSGTTSFNFIVTRGGDTTVTTTMDFTTADDSATTGDNDYVATSGTLTFAPGETSQTISVTVNGDVYLESDETFTVLLSNASAPAAISDNEAVGTITNDDLPPGISVGDVSVVENGGGGEFTVTLSPAVNGTVTVDYLITDGTAKNGIDYGVTPASGTLTFVTGITSQTIPFTVVDNTTADGNHSFNILLSNSSGPAITRAAATATIVDNEIQVVEVPAPPPATQCTDTNFENPGMIRTHFTNDADRVGLGCRLIAADGHYLSWLGSPLTSNANVGAQSVLNLGVVAAVDVFSSNGATGFVGDVNVCLKGSGYIIYMNANNAPRVPQLWSAWTTPSFPGYTCTTLYALGTVILVQQKPS